ncbi:hypothetical protein M514_06938 [Trichuris suis]|uniref:Ribosomal protein S30 n=1 Tax=Trichuris suis TaxID=68888 RepID=A0A085NLI0_9BILA|nr:hypothetical protein M513_06938 [Trichuris suis]KFD70326.1 hypothetical protein M514_06938 [Trichuris suis]
MRHLLWKRWQGLHRPSRHFGCRFFSSFDNVAGPHYSEKPIYPPVKRTSPDEEERMKFAEIVKALPTAPEKMHMVSPDERPWTVAEKTWHRPWMRPLIEPRRSYKISCPPDAYNLLPFYKYVTNTHVINGLPPFYDRMDVGAEAAQFKPYFVDMLSQELSLGAASNRSVNESTCNFFTHLSLGIITSFSTTRNHLSTAQVDQDSPCEAFWIRGGFKSLYPDGEKSQNRLTGDAYPGWGELAFSYSENVCSQVRTAYPLRPFVTKEEAVSNPSVNNDVMYTPELIGLKIRDDPLRMAPGFEYGDPQEFGLVTTRSFGDLYANLSRWEAEPEEEHECILSAGIGTCFAWLIGQAHFLGFTQYNDITYPLCGQAILTDLRKWYFFAYQMNTISLVDAAQPIAPNICWFKGPVKLFDVFNSKGEFENFNDEVINCCLRFFFADLEENPNFELRPYLKEEEEPYPIFREWV